MCSSEPTTNPLQIPTKELFSKRLNRCQYSRIPFFIYNIYGQIIYFTAIESLWTLMHRKKKVVSSTLLPAILFYSLQRKQHEIWTWYFNTRRVGLKAVEVDRLSFRKLLWIRI